VSYILNEFIYFFETAYDVTDSDFPSCALDRPSGSSGSGLMMIVNHFLDLDIFGILIPDAFAIGNTNAATGTGSIGAQADLCYATWGRMPNVILVDYYNLGEFFCLFSLFFLLSPSSSFSSFLFLSSFLSLSLSFSFFLFFSFSFFLSF
jgi:hypothetical protein